jgi:cytoskeletal protein CcmA (bactofilin family)
MMFGSKKKQVSGRVDTLVGRGASIQGDIAFKGGLHLDGRIVGNVRTAQDSSSKDKEASTLWVSEQGVIEGLVDVPNIVLNGTVVGDIQARERLVMGVKARVQGNVYYGVIEMAQGAEVSGKLVPTNASQAGKSQAALTGPMAVVASSTPDNVAARDATDDPSFVASVLDARVSRS